MDSNRNVNQVVYRLCASLSPSLHFLVKKIGSLFCDPISKVHENTTFKIPDQTLPFWIPENMYISSEPVGILSTTHLVGEQQRNFLYSGRKFNLNQNLCNLIILNSELNANMTQSVSRIVKFIILLYNSFFKNQHNIGKG